MSEPDVEFDARVQELVEALPEAVRARLAQDGYLIVTEFEHHCQDPNHGNLDGAHYPTVRQIVLYRRPWGDAVPSREQLAQVLWHEIGHALGLDHATLTRYGL